MGVWVSRALAYHRDMAKSKEEQVFSDQLEQWLKSKNNKTLASLVDAFEEKSFAVVFVLLMLLPALPIPTGGVTHVLEVVVVLVAIEMIIGRTTIWLPKWAGRIKLSKSVKGKTIPLILKRVRWFEDRSSSRGVRVFSAKATDISIGVLVVLFAMAAFVAPPFTGLDTLPSLGVVIIGLAMILEDARLLAVGALMGVVGVALVGTLGLAIFEGLTRIF